MPPQFGHATAMEGSGMIGSEGGDTTSTGWSAGASGRSAPKSRRRKPIGTTSIRWHRRPVETDAADAAAHARASPRLGQGTPVPTPSPVRTRVAQITWIIRFRRGARGSAQPRYDTVPTGRRPRVTRRIGGRWIVRFAPRAAGDLRGPDDAATTSLKQDGAKP